MGVKKKKPARAVQQKPRPVKKWQTGDYDRHATFSFILPYPFLLLCRLMETTPADIIRDFMENLSFGSWNREGREAARRQLSDYFITQGHGGGRYSEEELRELFAEMDALGRLFPKNGKSKLIDLYAAWREKHHEYWFKKWKRDSPRF